MRFGGGLRRSLYYHVNRRVMLLNGVDSSASSGKVISVSTEEHFARVVSAHDSVRVILREPGIVALLGWRGSCCATG